jgi:structural maintenance of chromosome 1
MVTAAEASVKELTLVLEQKREALKSLEARRDKVDAFVREQIEKRYEAQAAIDRARASGARAADEMNRLNTEFESYEAELREARLDQRESERREQDNRLLEDLQRLFTGVHGRVSDLCQPTQNRYAAAVSVALGTHMDSIVVADEQTAFSCIRYLKEQRRAPHTFLPLDRLVLKPIDESLRAQGDDIWLALDVLQYDRAVENAVRFVVGNAVICARDERARWLMFEQRAAGGRRGADKAREKAAADKGASLLSACLSFDRRLAITLDGTCYRRSGLVTGGLASLEAKAARWTGKQQEKHLEGAIACACCVLTDVCV